MPAAQAIVLFEPVDDFPGFGLGVIEAAFVSERRELARRQSGLFLDGVQIGLKRH
jgi:hypothetical protein